MGFGDSNKMKWGYIEDKKIFSLREISERINKNTIIIITVADVNAVEQIVETLNGCGGWGGEVRCYTYFALKRVVGFHINDKRISNEYREKIKEKVYRAYELVSIELAGLSAIRDIISCNKSILILQPAKVGSSSVKVSLENAGVKHIHLFSIYL